MVMRFFPPIFVSATQPAMIHFSSLPSAVQSVFRAFPGPLLVIELEQQLTVWLNQAAEKLLRTDVEEFAQTPVQNWILSDTDALIVQLEESANEHTMKPALLLDTEGEIHHSLMHVSLWEGELDDGVAKFLLLNFTDISAQQARLDSLNQTIETYQAALGGSKNGLLDWHLASDKFVIPDVLLKKLGYDPEETPLPPNGETFRKLLDAEDRERVWQTIETCLANRHRRFEVEFRFRRRSGGFLWMLMRTVLLISPAGHPYRMVGAYTDITELKLTHEQIRHQEEVYQLALAATGSGVWDWKLLKEDFFTQTHMPDLGEQSPHTAGKIRSFMRQLHPEDRQGFWEQVRTHILRKEDSFPLEFRMCGQDEQVRSMFGNAVLTYTADGQLLRLLGSYNDVTRLKDAEESYRLALEASQDGIWDWHLRTNRIFFSERFFQMMGYVRGELPESIESLRTLLTEEDARRFWSQVGEYLCQEASEFRAEFRMRRPDQSSCWVLARGIAVYDELSLPQRLVMSFADVTERKEAYEQLRDSEQRFLAAFDQAYYGMLLLDWELNVVFANEAVLNLLGYDFIDDGPSPLLNKTLEQLIEAQDYPSFLQYYRQFQQRPDSRWQRELRLYRRDRSTVWARVSVSSAKSEDQPMFFVMHIEDLTEQERLCASASDALPLEALGETAAILAHELTRPLSSIRIKSELAANALAQSDVAKTERKLDEITARAEQMHTMVQHMRDFSRRHINSAREAHHVEQLLREALKDLQPDITALNIELRPKLTQALPPVFCNASQIRRVFRHILRNAVEALATVTERILKLDTHASQDWVNVVIEDTGGGIEPEVKEQMFDAFFTTKSAGAGYGMGLAVTRRILDEHGCSLDVRTKVGEGTRFHIAFPASFQRGDTETR